MTAAIFIGYAATLLSVINQFPQAVKVIRTGDTHSISLAMYCLVEATITLWLVYGIMLGDGPLIVANALSLVPITYIWIVKMRNVASGKDRRRSNLKI